MEKMNISERRKYLLMMQVRYRQSDRKGKGVLLDEMQAMTGLHRKYLIGRLNSMDIQRRPRRRERGRHYGPEVQEAIWRIGDTLDWICAERLKPCLPEMARQLAAHAPAAGTTGTDQHLQRATHHALRSPAGGCPAPYPAGAAG